MIGVLRQASSQARPRRVRRPLPLRDVVETLTVVAVLAVVVWGIYYVRDPLRFPIREVSFESALVQASPEALREVVREHLRGGFASVDLGRIEQALETRPWVESASVRRRWPDALVIRITERRPVARWGTGALVSDRAEVFTPDSVAAFAGLPVLHGPPGQEGAVLARYGEIRALLRPAGLELRALAVDSRRAWRLLLDVGIPVELGRGPLEARVRRLVQVYPRLLAGQSERIARIDLRYTNGVAVAWNPAPADGHSKDGNNS